jgi:hypothetical protein
MKKISLTEPSLFSKLVLGLLLIVLLVMIAHKGYDFGQWLKR